MIVNANEMIPITECLVLTRYQSYSRLINIQNRFPRKQHLEGKILLPDFLVILSYRIILFPAIYKIIAARELAIER